MNKKAIFWLVFGFLIVLDAGLLMYQFVYKKPKADAIPEPPAVNKTEFNLLPASNPDINAPQVNFIDAEKIYTVESGSFYSSPVLLKRTDDTLLFLARGKASVKYDEIIYAKSFDLSTWEEPVSVKKFDTQKIIDLFGAKTDFGFFLFYVTQDEANKYATAYLYSQDGTNWEEKNIELNTDDFVKGSITQDQNSLRVVFLNKDKRTVEQSFFIGNKSWTDLKTVIKLNLDIEDLGLIKIGDYYYLLFSDNNVLYETGSLDFHTFNQAISIVNLKDNNFNLNNSGVSALSGESVYLNKIQ
jgi:hypothetical protein